MNQNQNRRPPEGSRPAYDPRREAARRAYIEKKRRRIRRNRILLGSAAAVILTLLVLLIVLIGKGISAAVQAHREKEQTDSGKSKTEVTETIADTVSDIGTHTAADTDARESGSEKTDVPVISGNTEGQLPASAETEAAFSFPAMPETVVFQADLKDYERYMNPVETEEYLILVNPEHPLTAADAPTDLIDVVNTRKDGRAVQKMRYTAEKALEALYLEAQAEGMLSAQTPSGYVLSVTSAYRDYATQAYLFSSYTEQELAANASLSREQAEAKVETYSCRPGTSEHQTGLCCDMHTLSGADISFAKEEQASWLADNAWKFGFILRFPKDKTDVTKISYEPWHFRYVGRLHAYRIHELGLCLEEYVELLEKVK